MIAEFCNVCYILNDIPSKATYYIWRCLHVACEKCIKNSLSCPVCGKRSKPKSLAEAADKLEDPISLYKRLEIMCQLETEQDAIQLDYYVNKIPLEIDTMERNFESLKRFRAQIEKAKEKENKQAKKMKHYIEHYSKQYDQFKDGAGSVSTDRNTSSLFDTSSLISEAQSKPPTISSRSSDNSFLASEAKSEYSWIFEKSSTKNHRLHY